LVSVRKELGLPGLPPEPLDSLIDIAFKKFMKDRDRPVQRVNPEFNPWFSKETSNEKTKNIK
jgi:hypothetical protein